MSILHINAGNMYGGVETFLVTLARWTAQSGDMRPSFAVCFDGRFTDELRALDAPVHMLGPVRASRPWTVWPARRRLREILQKLAFEAVVCHMPWNHAIFAPEVRRAGQRLVFWAHGQASGKGWVETWAHLTAPDLAIANSRFTAASLSDLFPGIRTEVIYYPVAAASSTGGSSVRQRMGASQDTVVIVQVSRMEPWKGHSLHLRALARLKHILGWSCWMVGGAQRPAERQYVNELRRQATELGISERVHFLGSSANVAGILEEADIFCQPNQSPEPFGIVFVEALHAGLPVVTTAIGGALEIITENEGRLTPAGDVDALAAALCRLIESREERIRLGRCGPERARTLCDPARQVTRIQAAVMDHQSPVGCDESTDRCEPAFQCETNVRGVR
jgi:glycosyltransferase involved in cell wall biosynthesis